MAFFEVEFPRTISYHAIGGPGFSTNINMGFSGQEQRNRNWANSRGKWTVSLITPAAFDGNRQAFTELLNGFFLNAGGRADAFRLKDHKDYQGINQALVTVGSNVMVAKHYTIGGRTYIRIITKPVGSGVVDYQGNSLANTVFLHGASTPVTVDSTTGIVTGQSAGTAVDFQFHFPVRFDTDELPLQAEESNFGSGEGIVSLHSVQLLEVLPPNY